jgi:hypothetical protein
LNAALRVDRSLTWRELALVALGLTVLAGLSFGSSVIHNGFHLDDWSNAADALYPPPGTNALETFKDATLFRPVLVLYVPLTYFVFGMHMWLHLLWAIAIGVAACFLLYTVLRTLGLPWVHACFITVLVLLFPWFDATRFWPTAAQVPLSISITLVGLLIALKGLSRDSLKWHVGAALLYLISILTYEVTLPLIAVLGVLYVWRVGWRAGRVRWGMDLVAVVVGGTWVGTHTARTKSGLSGDFTHLRAIVDGGAEMLGLTAIPLGEPHTTLVLVILAAIFATGIAALLFSKAKDEPRQGWWLRSWLLLAGGGLAVVVLGWVIFIPADPYYTPAIWGITNRVNGLAGIGLVILVYAAFGVLTELAARVWRWSDSTVLAITSCLAILLAVGYFTVVRRHTGIWDSSYQAEVTAIDRIQARYPDLPPGTTLYTSDYPANQTLGVPILSAIWDLNGMVQTSYEDGTLKAYPVVEGFTLKCGANGVGMVGTGAPKRSAPYGTARLFDLATGNSARPLSRRECLAVAGEYLPGPLYLSYDY